MKKLIMLVVLALSVILTGCVIHAPQKMTTPQLANFVADESVALVINGKNHSLAFCSGVWISPNIILTANHCIEGYVDHMNDLFDQNQEYKDARITYIVPREAGDIGKPLAKTNLSSVYYLDPSSDLALLKAIGTDIPKHRSAKLAASSPVVGSDVYAIGNVTGNYFTFRKGMVSAYRKDMISVHADKGIHGPFLQASILASFGDSGGALFDENGNIIGITSFMDGEAPGIIFYIHLNTIRKLMMEHQLLPIPLQ